MKNWGDRLWVLTSALLWLLVGALKLQVARVIPYDILALVLLLVAVFFRVVPTRGSTKSIQPSASGLFYLAFVALVFAGFLSGLHASQITIWAVEVGTFAYMGVMLLSVDIFSRGRVDRFLRIGAWAFALMCGVFGVLAVTHLLGAPKVVWFYEFSPVRGYTEKFTGLMRYANQWSGYFVGIFPLALALVFETRAPWKRVLLLVCVVLGAATVPATGSRSGIFLLVFQTAGFVGLYAMLSRSGQALSRMAYVVLFALAAVAAYILTFEVLGDSAIVQRSFGAFELVFEQEEFADSWRTYNWNAAWGEWLRHPLIGMGLGTFELYYDKHEIHSSYLSFLAETGVLGAIPYVAVVLIPTIQLCRAIAYGAAQGRTDIWNIALLVAVGTQIVFAIHHNNTRHRHVWLVLVLASIYAEFSIARLRAELRERALARQVLRR